MNVSHIQPGPLVALISGILILVMPRLLNYVIAFYLIIIGIIGLLRWKRKTQDLRSIEMKTLRSFERD